VVVPADMVKLDTLGTNGLYLSRDKYFYYLTITYMDLMQYDVIKRYKTLTIDQANMLPVTVRHHQ